MKKAFVVALAAAAALVLGACGKSADTESPVTLPQVESYAEESDPTTGLSETPVTADEESVADIITDEGQFEGTIEDGMFVIQKCLSNKDTIIVPDEIDGAPVGKIGDHAFYTLPCKSIVLPDSVFYIGESAFLECKNLEQISLGNGIKTIGVYAFQSCLKLKSVSFPEGMETIEGPLFLDDEELEEVYIPISVVNLPERIASNKTCPKIVIVTPTGSEAEKVALAQGLTVRNPEGNETAATPSTDTVDRICESIGCTKKQAENIASRLSKLELPAITSIEKGSADDNSITVTTEDGMEYEVGVDKLYRVYSVKDMETDEYIFTITE